MHRTAYLSGPKCFGLSQKKSWFDEGERISPGPAAHKPLQCREQSPEWKIGIEAQYKRNTFLRPGENCPSPQHYQPKPDAVEKNETKMSIPKQKKHKKVEQNTQKLYKPQLSPTKQAAPHFSFGDAKRNDYSTLPPGPGHYETVRVDNSSFNRSQREFSLKQRPGAEINPANPGPGAYLTLNQPKNTTFSFSRTPRSRQPESNEPLAVFQDIGGKKKPLSGSHIPFVTSPYRSTGAMFATNEYPAPNAYKNEPLQQKIGVIISRAKRISSFDTSKGFQVPGPQKYNIKAQLHENNAVAIPKDTHRFAPPKDNPPGPGAYEKSSSLGHVGGAMSKISPQNKVIEREQVPGAGHYDPVDRMSTKRARSVIVFDADRTDFSKTVTKGIGPGFYNARQKGLNNELGKLGKSARKELYSPDRHPGAGQYEIPSSIGKLPSYYTAPRKMNQSGFSTYQMKAEAVMLAKQRRMQQQEEQENNEQELNPESEVSAQ